MIITIDRNEIERLMLLYMKDKYNNDIIFKNWNDWNEPSGMVFELNLKENSKVNK